MSQTHHSQIRRPGRPIELQSAPFSHPCLLPPVQPSAHQHEGYKKNWIEYQEGYNIFQTLCHLFWIYVRQSSAGHNFLQSEDTVTTLVELFKVEFDNLIHV